MEPVVISSTGLFTPPEKISNDELVASFNRYVDKVNADNANAIATNTFTPLEYSSSEFIIKASGIESRYVMEKSGILDIERMRPLNLERPMDQPTLQCETSVAAAKQAMETANIGSHEIDAVIAACSNFQRPYPAISIEIQHALGIDGFAFDLNVACASAAFAIQTGWDVINNGHANTVLIVNPELCSAGLNFRDRDSHFIFGDATTAIILQKQSLCQSHHPYQLIDSRLKTQFSNNIRSNFGFTNRTNPDDMDSDDKLFIQQGRKVFKEVVPMVSELILAQLSEMSIEPDKLERMWLHQANKNMNDLICKRIKGRPATMDEAPIILSEYANTSSAGSIIAFHLHHDDLASNQYALLSAFGAGYSVGSLVLKKC